MNDNVGHESYLAYRNYRYLKLALLLSVAATLAYLVHDPISGPNGGTGLGYGLGSWAAFQVLLLAWYGVRKRQYASGAGKVKAWLSAHVYLGLSTLLIASLHTGFEFSWNFHLLVYLLLWLVVVSGIYGTVAYSRYPTLMTMNRAGANPQQMLDEVAELDERALTLADEVDPKIHDIVLRSVGSTRIGGGVLDQLRGFDASTIAHVQAADAALRDKEREWEQASGHSQQGHATGEIMPARAGRRRATMFFVASELVQVGGGEKVEKLRNLMEVLNRKKALVAQLNLDIRQRARLQIWLYWHVPASIALLAGLLIHIVAVFFYR